MKQIRIFKNTNEICLVQEVNEFISNNEVKVIDIQFSSTGGSFMFATQYSVMIVIEEDEV